MFRTFASVSIVNFEHVIAGWDIFWISDLPEYFLRHVSKVFCFFSFQYCRAKSSTLYHLKFSSFKETRETVT